MKLHTVFDTPRYNRGLLILFTALLSNSMISGETNRHVPVFLESQLRLALYIYLYSIKYTMERL